MLVDSEKLVDAQSIYDKDIINNSMTQSMDVQMDTQGFSFDIPTSSKTTSFLTTQNPLSSIENNQENEINNLDSLFILKNDQKTLDIALNKVNLIVDRMTAGIYFINFFLII